ncbi:hypothetical protein [Dyadobacter crusticola]|uniref:hypothetical protein n=1 Tax=Dyadobacter crusticola TaxID=292407 RepID=UPI0012F8D37C|nr:hypothetical protein [Dyadobacter crusticola]
MKTPLHNHSLRQDLNQNNRLPIRLVSPDFGHISMEHAYPANKLSAEHALRGSGLNWSVV